MRAFHKLATGVAIAATAASAEKSAVIAPYGEIMNEKELLNSVVEKLEDDEVSVEAQDVSVSTDASGRQLYASRRSKLTTERSLRRRFRKVERRAKKNGRKTLATHPNDGKPYVIELRRNDFDEGTVILDKPGYYVLKDNVNFNPNPGQNWMPDCDSGRATQVKYCTGDAAFAYRLGFFAAIAMAGEDIVLDLDGHRLQQSKEHALQQRFYANIELADQPFIAGQGPAGDNKFGLELKSCNFCSVQNGKIFRSSHHGIHANGAHNILVENVKFRDHEVAAIHLNNVKHSAIVNVNAVRHRTDVPVRASYSAGRFLTQFTDYLLQTFQSSLSPAAYADLHEKSTRLTELMDATKDYVLNGNENEELMEEIQTQFAPLVAPDGRRVIDGNAYGIVIHSTGIAIGAFPGVVPEQTSEDVTIRKTKIQRVRGIIPEVISLTLSPDAQDPLNDGSGSQAIPQVDVAGASFDYEDSVDANGYYKATRLHDLRFALAWWASPEFGNDAFLVETRRNGQFGTFKIQGRLAAWARSNPPQPISTVTGQNFICNKDSMLHGNKGVLGLWVQGGKDVKIDDVLVQNVKNYGLPRTTLCGEVDPFHPSRRQLAEKRKLDTAPFLVGSGCETRGIAITASKDVTIEDTSVKGIRSTSCNSYGIHVFNGAENTDINNSEVKRVIAPAGSNTFDIKIEENSSGQDQDNEYR